MRYPASGRRVGGVDLVAAGLTVVLMALFALSAADEPGNDRPLDAIAVGLLVSATALLLAHRRFPGPMALAILALNFWWHAAGYASEAINVPTVLAYFSVGLTGRRPVQWGVGALTAVLLVGSVAVTGGPWTTLIDAIGWTAAAILLGEVVRSRGELLAHYAERAERAEAERDLEAERRVAEERLRIARELHDVLAHTVSVMAVQAEVAADALDRAPATGATPEARAAVGAIRAAGLDAMAEVRATVSILRGADPALGTAPAPGLARLDELIETARAAGLEVTLDWSPPDGPLPPMVGLTAYRVVQEALTNVVRHAGASCVRVRMRRDGPSLVVEVTDDGQASGATATPAAGLGLRGMAERVSSLGGTLDAGPRPGGGFRVRAALPVGDPAP